MAETEDNRGAQALRRLRLTQEEIAERLSVTCGRKVHQGTVSHWQTGSRKPSAARRVELKKAFRIPFDLWDQGVPNREIRTASR